MRRERTGLPMWLFALGVASFVLFTDDYIIAGILPEIADEFAVSEAQVGQLVTVFAVTVALSAPVFAAISRTWDRRVVLPVALVGFAVANAAIALAPTLELIFALRIMTALCVAASVPALPAIAGKLAPPERVGTFVAVVSLGTASAIVVGLPAGTWIGAVLGWRWTFVFLAVLGVIAAGFAAATLPSTVFSTPQLSGTKRLLDGPIVTLMAIQGMVLTATMILLIYLAPFAAELAGVGAGLRGALFAVAGVAGVAGLLCGGRAADRWGARRTLLIGITALATVLVMLAGAWTLRPIPVAAMVIVAGLWGFAAFWNSPPVQVQLNARAGGRGSEVFAVANTVSYLCVAGAGATGGVVLTTVGVGGLPIAGLACALVALGLVAVVLPRLSRAAS